MSALSFAVSTEGYQESVDALHSTRVAFSSDARWIVGVGAEYGAYVEFGTSRMRAQPYLFPAARYVMRTRFERLERMAMSQPNPMEWLVATLAQHIEREAKARAPVDTGNLRASIRAVPASRFR